jgi:hypothetical protein
VLQYLLRYTNGYSHRKDAVRFLQWRYVPTVHVIAEDGSIEAQWYASSEFVMPRVGEIVEFDMTVPTGVEQARYVVRSIRHRYADDAPNIYVYVAKV